MKKIVAFVLLVLLCLSFCSCSFCFHTFDEATCTAASTCSKCGKTEGDPLGHSWKPESCTTAKTCTRCYAKEGEPKGHSWIEATCTTPSKCVYCSATYGSTIDHEYKDFKCVHCGEVGITTKDVPKILDITKLDVDMNSVGGLDVYITAKNKSSSKTIKYIRYNLSFFNAVGDKLSCEIRRNNSVTLEQVGPVKPKKSTKSGTYWEACFYNSTYANTLTFNWIEIEYTDGTSLTLEGYIANEAVVRWR